MVLRMVNQALKPYGPDAAEVEFAWESAPRTWFAYVRPRRDSAASLDVAYDNGDLNISVGNTWFEVFRVGDALESELPPCW